MYRILTRSREAAWRKDRNFNGGGRILRLGIFLTGYKNVEAKYEKCLADGML